MAGSGGEYACTLTATDEVAALRTSWMYRGPNARAPAGPTGLARTCPVVLAPTTRRSTRVPQTTANAPADPPWSWNPVAWPGSQLITHTSWLSSRCIRSYQRPAGFSRTRPSQSAGLAASRRATSASCRAPSSWPGRTRAGAADRIIVLILVSPHVDIADATRQRQGELKRPDGPVAGPNPVRLGRAGPTSHDAGRQRESAGQNALTGRR